TRNQARADDGRMTLTYTGTFYGPRSPQPLVAALERLPAESARLLRVRIVGPVESAHRRLIARSQAASIIELLEQVSYEDSMRLLASSDCLLLLDAPNAT